MRIGTLYVVSRERAGLRAPKDRRVIARPVPRSWIHHTVGDPNIELERREVHRKPKWSERMFLRAACRYWREVQSFHMNARGYSDIGYSFGIAPGVFGLRARVLVGRGAGIEGAHTLGDNGHSLGIVVFGDFTTKRLNPLTRRKVRRLLDNLVAIGELEDPRCKHPTGGHQDAPNARTACPGRYIMKWIDNLRHPVTRARRT